MARLERVREIAGRVAGSEGVELVDVELHGRGPGTVLRIYLDKPGGITHLECQKVSQQLGMILDVEDVMDARYVLEVSSPGLDRRLVTESDFQRFAGSNIKIVLKVPRDGQKRFQGRLMGMEAGTVRLQADSGAITEVAPDEVERANLVPDFGGKFESKPDPKRSR
jgi:ribosome maturation factor RimP